MRKNSLVLASLSFALLLIFIIEGCVNKTPLVFVEETIGGVDADKRKENPVILDEFLEALSAADLRELESSSQLLTVSFNFDQYNIRHDYRSVLFRNASWLKEHPEIFIKIVGHCDERGTEDYNLALGDRRANAAKDYLVSFGIESSRIKSISYGEERPVCKENNELCWSQNRRAEFLISISDT